MRIFLKFLFVSLLLVLLVALGTEVAALRHQPQPAGGPAAAPVVVVRKSSAIPPPRRSVHTVRHRASQRQR